MSHDARWRPAFWLGLTVLLLVLSVPSSAHDTQVVGSLRLTIGWGEEPAFAGSRNSVTVVLSDTAGAPVTDLGGGSLTVEVSFGSERIVLPLQPAWARRNEFRAWLLPTRPGTYVFHITGQAKGQAIDVRSTCSNKTFDCIADSSEIQFPVKDPSAGQLAERIERSLPRADQAVETAARARTVAMAALGVAVLALVSGVGLGLRRNRQDR